MESNSQIYTHIAELTVGYESSHPQKVAKKITMCHFTWKEKKKNV